MFPAESARLTQDKPASEKCRRPSEVESLGLHGREAAGDQICDHGHGKDEGESARMMPQESGSLRNCC